MVIRTNRDGAQTQRVYAAEERINLTGAFEPLQLRESAGFSAKPLQREYLNVEANVGLAAQQIAVRDGYVLADDSATLELELNQLRTQHQSGGEVSVKVYGEWEKRLGYKLEGNVMQPFYTNNDDVKGIDALQAEFKATLSVKIIKWISLDYVLLARRVPSIIRDWQIQNGLVLAVKYQVF